VTDYKFCNPLCVNSAFNIEVHHRTKLAENAVFEMRYYRHREDIEKTINQAARVGHNGQIRLSINF
jgi:hypothetical protein